MAKEPESTTGMAHWVGGAACRHFSRCGGLGRKEQQRTERNPLSRTTTATTTPHTHTQHWMACAGVIEVITNDGRVIKGILRGYDQTSNVILEDSCELVFSTTVCFREQQQQCTAQCTRC
jgi:LSM domain